MLAWAIARYPITPTTRDATQASLILALLHRKIDPDIIRQIGPLWLQHSNNQATEPDTQLQNFKTAQTTAEKAFNYCLNYTLKNPRLQSVPDQPPILQRPSGRTNSPPDNSIS